MTDNEEIRTPPRSQPTALGLGERLRSARKSKALSIQQVSEVLRLEEPLVTAIEEDRFEALGAPVFVRGHLRRYAQLVGLPVDSVLNAYLAAAPQSSELPVLTRRRIEPAIEGVGSWVLWLAGAVLLVVMVFFLVDEEPPPPSSLPVAPAPLAPQPVPVPLPEAAPIPVTPPASFASPQPAAEMPQPASAAAPEMAPPATTPAAGIELAPGASDMPATTPAPTPPQ